MLSKGQPEDKIDSGHTRKKQTTTKVVSKEPVAPLTSTGGSTTSGKSSKSLNLA